MSSLPSWIPWPLHSQRSNFCTTRPVGNVSSVSHTHNGTHLVITWAAQEPEIFSSSYFVRLIPFAQTAVYPPQTNVVHNATMIRRARPTHVEDALTTFSLGGEKFVSVSMENLFNISPLDGEKNGTSRVVSRRLIGAVIDVSVPSDQVHSIICYTGRFLLSDLVGPAMVANCSSSIALDGVQFSAMSGTYAGEEDNLLGQVEISIVPGNFTVEIPIDPNLVSGSSAVVIPAADGVQMLKQVHFPTPSFTTMLLIEDNSVFQVRRLSDMVFCFFCTQFSIRTKQLTLFFFFWQSGWCICSSANRRFHCQHWSPLRKDHLARFQ